MDSIKYVLPLLSGILVQDDDNISQIKSSEYKQKFRFAITQRSDYLKFIIYYVVAVIWLLNKIIKSSEENQSMDEGAAEQDEKGLANIVHLG